ncbi:MAG: arginine--tRNA ligase [Clostridia bacterium]|nr:arginine--tRNA ligase [Clostridia bacterium]
MYNFVRIIILTIITLILLIIILKNKSAKTKTGFIIGLIIWNVCRGILYNIPFENYFMSFETPEDIVKYMGRDNYETTIEGKETALMLYTSQNGAFIMEFVNKVDGKYKLPTTKIPKIERKLTTDYGDVTIYNVLNTQDYYMDIAWICTKDIQEIILNNDKLEFYKIYVNDDENTIIIYAKAYLEYYPNGNCLNIDGTNVYF